MRIRTYIDTYIHNIYVGISFLAVMSTTANSTTMISTTVTPTALMASPSGSTTPISTVVSTSSVVTTLMSNTMTVATVAQSSSDNDGDSSVGIIAGCVIGVVLCVTLLLVVILLWWCLRRRKGKLDVLQDKSECIANYIVTYHIYPNRSLKIYFL